MTDHPLVQPETVTVPIEVRDSDEGEKLHGILIQEGRASSGGRAEIFSPNSVEWPASGITIHPKHGDSTELGRAVPARHPNGEIRIAMRATPELRSAVASGRKYLSLEFFALQQLRTSAGVREILRAYVPSAALSLSPEYTQATVEIRNAAQTRVRRWR